MPITIAIDGHAGCGKSTTARRVADQLGYLFIDSGAMYRAIALGVLRYGLDPADEAAVTALLPHLRVGFVAENNPDAAHSGAPARMVVSLNGKPVEAEIRTPEVAQAASLVSQYRAVRQYLVAEQQRLGREGTQGIVMDGRDIGTVVFPNAELKVYMTASLEARSRRRHAEMVAKGIHMPLPAIAEDLLKRDQQDINRAESPLRKAADALVLDTTEMDIDQQVQTVLQWAEQKQAVSR